jgi:hypothetical protein
VLPALFFHGRSALAASAALLFVLGLARAATAGDTVREYVDEITAVSITVSTEPLVFARERSDLAVNARDYLTLAPLEINRTGKRGYFWSGYLWSTIDRRGRQPILARGDTLVLVADGRPIALLADGHSLRDHGVGQPPTPVPIRTAVPVLFSASPETLAYVARAQALHVELIHEGSSESFSLWKEGRDGTRAFVERLELTQ